MRPRTHPTLAARPAIVATLALLASLGAPRIAAAKLYRYPLAGDKGTVTAYFDHSGKDWNCGTKRYTGHKGSDFGVAKGTPIYAAAAGSVVYVNDGCADDCSTGSCGCGGGFGNYVKLQHADGKHTYYAHMQIWSVKVKTGDSVTCGQHLGNVASSGNSTGNHLHFEVRVPTTSDDPYTGSCGGPLTYWVQQGTYLGRPGTACATAPPPPDAGPPPPDTKPPPPPPDSKPPPPKDTGAPSPDHPPLPGTDGALPPVTDALAGEVPPVWPGGANDARTLSGGCAVGGAGTGAAVWLVLLGLLFRRLWSGRRCSSAARRSPWPPPPPGFDRRPAGAAAGRRCAGSRRGCG